MFVALATLTGCELPRGGRPSVLVIAVEGLGVDAVPCDNEEVEAPGHQGFQVLCQEGVRFTHAFAPSTMSQATMASLLTGLFPFEHGIRNNGSVFLPARYKTLAEDALEKRYHTLFVSGGPPMWRKSGLAQGFEVFDDVMDLSPGNFYRPAPEVFKIATQWMDQNDDGRPFFTILFLADLQFPTVATTDDEGEARERSRAGQLEEIDESAGQLIRWLKSKKKWNRTNIVLVGLNSLSLNSETGEPFPLNLHSKSVQVSLLIKPARKEQDNVIQWGIDRNVSLLDLSHTIFAWIGMQPPVTAIPELQPVSLNPVLTQPQPAWKENRLLLSESGWPDWLEGAGIRFSVRQGQFLYIHDQKPLIYNTLTDRNEGLPLKSTDPLWTSLNGDVMRLLRHPQFVPFKGMQSHWRDQLQIAQELWLDGAAPRSVRGGEAWARWYLRRALIRKDWKEVRHLSQEMAEPIGTYIASRHLNETAPLPKSPCVRLVLGPKSSHKNYQSECEDEKVLALYSWKEAKNDEERKQAQERFSRLFAHYWFDQEVGRFNYLNGLRWDVDRELPQGPQLADYLLTLKEFESFAKANLSLLNSENASF